jgi:7SK snRNA methylphosphate capping enzyme
MKSKTIVVETVKADDTHYLSTRENPVTLVREHEPFRFGNYKKYYTLRYEKRWNDPRLSVLSKEYFHNKRVLDIGCNDGTLTLLIAMRYFPNKI